MASRIHRIALRLQTTRLWIPLLLSFVLAGGLTVAIIIGISFLLRRELTPDYLLTGGVTAGICSLIVVAVLLKVVDVLRDSEAKYRTLIETTNTGYLILDGQGIVLDANQEYVRLTGHTSLAQIVGRGVVEWTAQHDQKRNAAEVAKCMKAGFVSGLEIDYVGPGGALHPHRDQCAGG